MKCKNVFVTAAVFMLLSLSINAQTDTSAVNLDEVIIQTNRFSDSGNEPAADFTVLGRDVLNSMPLLSLDDALSETAGVFVFRPLGILGAGNVGIRGLGMSEPGRVLVLQDGVPINKSDLGAVNWNRIIPAGVTKIEIFKGPGSSVYGTDAMGGIINVMTIPSDKAKDETCVNFSYGSFATAGVSASLTNVFSKAENLSLKADFMLRSSDGYITTPDSLRDSTIIASWMKEGAFNFSGNYKMSNRVKTDFSYNYYNDRRSQGIRIFDEVGNVADHDTHFFRNRFKGTYDKLNWSLNYYFQREHYFRTVESFKKSYSFYYVNSIRSDFGLLSNVSYHSGKNSLTGGIDIRGGNVNGADEYQTSTDVVRNEGELLNFSGFVSDRFDLSEKFMLKAAVNYNLTETHGIRFILENPTEVTDFLEAYESGVPDKILSAFSPEFSVSYHRSHLNIYAKYSNGYRVPSLDDLSRTGFIAGAFKLANPDLKAEYSKNGEMGINSSFGKFQTDLIFYYSSAHNFAAYSLTGEYLFGKKPIVIKRNITEAELYGSEVSLKYIFSEKAECFVNYTFSGNKILQYETKPELEGKKLMFLPEHKLNTGFNLNFSRIKASVFGDYFSQQFSDEVNTEIIPVQFILNAKITVPVYKSFEFSVSGRNLLNNQYIVNYSQLSMGRFINFEMTWSL